MRVGPGRTSRLSPEPFTWVSEEAAEVTNWPPVAAANRVLEYGMRSAARVIVRSELFLINLASGLMILLVRLADVTALRVAVGLPFLLFFPGYALTAALFPKERDIALRERIALSVGLSAMLTPAVGLVLTHFWGIRLYPVLVSLAILVAALSAVAWWRRWTHLEEDEPDSGPARSPGGVRPGNPLEWMATAVLGLAVVGAVGVMAYAFASPERGERFSEFYLAGPGSHPGAAVAGDNITVSLGIVNREEGAMRYRVQALAGGPPLMVAGPINLDQGEVWEGEVVLPAGAASARTALTEAVTPPADDAGAAVGVLRVETAAGFEPGDHLLVGGEAGVVESVEEDAIVLAYGLRQEHPPGAEVAEVQKVELRLFKSPGLGDEETSLALWVGKEGLAATVYHLGAAPASYRIDVLVSVDGGEPVAGSAAGPPAQVAGEAWAAEIGFPFSEMNDVRFALYRDDALLFEKLEPRPYPSLHRWVVVR